MQPKNLFSDVSLKWGGETYIVEASRVMMLVAEIEEYITLDELMNKAGLKRVRLAQAYLAALTFAGAKNISLEDIYAGMFNRDDPSAIQNVVTGLLMMMVPPVDVADKMPQADKKPAPVKKKSSTARKRTKR